MHYRFDPYSSWGRTVTRSYMGADIYRGEDRYIVEVDVPGVAEDAIDVTVEKKTLSITVDRPAGTGEGFDLVSRGRPTGTFTRRFYLGDGLDADGVEAGLENGVLTISIPVVETAKARKIEVGTVRPAIEA